MNRSLSGLHTDRLRAVARSGSAVGGHAIRTRVCALALLVTIALGALASVAQADGDPGSDVLVSQNLFVAADANASVNQQVQLGGLLQAAARAGLPVRVAIIANRDDLGAVTALWLKPSAYAQFLGIELSLAYKQRLLVVMPNGFGINWPGHNTASADRLLANIPTKAGGASLLNAADTAVRRLAAAAGVKLAPSTPRTGEAAGAAPPSSSSAASAAAAQSGSRPAAAQSASAPAPAQPGSAPGRTAVPSGSGDGALVFAASVAALAAIVLTVRFAARRRRRDRPMITRATEARRQASLNRRLRWAIPGLALLVGVFAGISIVAVGRVAPRSVTSALAANPYLDPGTPLSRPAPGFTLSDQFGEPVSLRSFRGKVVILAFNDSECTTICPLTTTAMLDAKRMLGTAGRQVQLLGVDADPKATSIEDVLSYSQLHGMLREWHFLTGSLSQLKRVWKAYGIEAEIDHGLISHTPALFVLDPQGRMRKLYLTQQSYTAVGQLGQLLAQEASSLLPSHPRVHSSLSYAEIPEITPGNRVVLPKAGGGTVRLGPGGSPRLFVFFATWDQEVTSLAGQLQALNRYQSAAGASGLPALTAVDEGSVEPGAAALPRFLKGLSQPLSYPVAIDQSGRVADGYGVQGEPWLVLTSATGRILWYRNIDTTGWLSRSALDHQMRDALARAPKAPASAAAAEQELAGSPAPLAALHAQASRLLGSSSALASGIRALHGYPIVINVWASWCAPCQAEFGLFADASAHYGRQVAFLGADTNDTSGNAEAFLAGHPISYPSYQTTPSQLQSVMPGGLESLPTTIYINRAGKVVDVHIGQYESQGTLDGDIESYALGG